MSNLVSLVFLACVGIHIVPIETAKLEGNGYTLTMAISEDFNSPEFDNPAFLDSIQDVLTRASAALFKATDYRVYFENVEILLPRTWNSAGTTTWAFDYVNADVRIEDTLNDMSEKILSPRVHHSKPCGYSGEYIIVPPEFFADDNQVMSSRYGDLAKVFLHEWAHYRYGVFEEYGYPQSDGQFPYSYVNIDGHRQVTSCNETQIPGVLSTRPDATENDCTLDNENCRFRPDLGANASPSASLMYMQFLPQATKFCDRNSHDPLAPNQHNFWCRNRSVKTVINRHPDLQTLQPLANTTDTRPTFRFLKPVAPAVYIVVDTSTHTDSTAEYQQFFDAVKVRLQGLLTSLSADGATSPVSILSMSGQSYNSTSTLGGYVKTLAGPVQVQTGLNDLREVVNNLNRVADGLLLDRALADVVDLVTPYTYLSGSVILLFKMSQVTDFSFRPMESELINMLNARNSRLVAVEFSRNARDFNLERVSSEPYTDGSYQKVEEMDQLTNKLDTAVGVVLQAVKSGRFISRRPHIGRDQKILSSNVTETYESDETDSELVVSVHIPSNVADDEVTFKLFDRRNMTYDSSRPDDPWSATYLSSWSWGWNQYKIHTFRYRRTGAIAQCRYEISYSGAGNVMAYIDVIQIMAKQPATGGGGNSQSKIYDVEVFTSADKGDLNMAAPGEEPVLLIYTSVSKGFGFGLVTAVKATVHEPNGTSINIFLKDDGKYPDSSNRDGVSVGQFRPRMNGLHRVSVDVYRRTPNVPLPPRQRYLHALPIDQELEYPYCFGEDYCELSAVSLTFRRILPYAAKVTVRNVQGAKPRPRRIFDLKLKIADNYSSADLSWTAPSNASGDGPVDSYRLVYGTSLSSLLTESGFIPTAAVPVNASDVLVGSLTPLAPGSAQSVTIRLDQFETYHPLYFTIASVSNNIESEPAPVVFAPRRSAPPPMTEKPSSTAGTSPTAPSTSQSPSTTSARTSTTSRTTPTTGSPTERPATSETTEGSSTTTASGHRFMTSVSSLMLLLTIAAILAL